MSKYNGNDHTKDENDNHGDQMNPNNDTYYSDRGEDGRPEDWEESLNEN